MRRLAPLATALTAAGLLVALPQSASAATVSATEGVTAPDFATATWGDPWDYSNPEDILIANGGPTMNVENAGVSSGLLNFTMSKNGYLSPLWGGYPGGLYLGREGGDPQNQIDADEFTHFALHAYASKDTPAGLFWWTCEGLAASCQGGMPFSVQAGWHTYHFAVRNSDAYGFPQEWAGNITGFRVALSPSSSTTFAFDWMRLYDPGATVTVSGGDVVWDADSDPANNGRVPGSGPVPASGDLSFLPPGVYRFLDDGSYSEPVLLRRPATPVVLDPDVTGGLDYSEISGDPWDMNSPADVREVGNATVLGYAPLRGRNVTNDPFVWLNLKSGPIDPNRFHRMSVTSSYEGGFSLEDAPGGGSHGRVIWHRAGDAPGTVVQTKEWVTYAGISRQTVDLTAPDVHEDDAGNKFAWTSAPVDGLRWDPNEDRGPRVWTLDHVSLRADDEAHTSFDIRWHDAGYVPGSTVTIYRQDDANGTNRRALVTDLPQHPGTNVFRWNSSATPAGRYWIAVEVNGPGGTGIDVSSGPVHVRHDLPGAQSPSPAFPISRDLNDACPQDAVPNANFVDVPPSSVHAIAVNCLAWWGVTQGSAGGGYDPNAGVRRDQMASFLARVYEESGGVLPDNPADYFADDDGSPHELRINQLAELDIVRGEANGQYNPAGLVSRRHMATFLVRTYEKRAHRVLPEPGNYFEDDNGLPDQLAINKAAGAGIASGVSDVRFNPLHVVRRGQMASFLARTLDVLVAGGHGRPPAL